MFLSARVSLCLSLSPQPSAVISQTMAIYDKVPLRAICQENLWDERRKDGSRKGKGNDSECMDSLRTKGTMCRVNEEGFCVFCAATMPE